MTELLKTQPINQLQDQSAIIDIISLGYVSLPLALRDAKAAWRLSSKLTDLCTKVESYLCA